MQPVEEKKAEQIPGVEANPQQQAQIKEELSKGKLFMKMDVSVLNMIIKSTANIDKGKVSDGFHTFGELYEHRNRLFIALCKAMMPVGTGLKPWRSKKSFEGKEEKGWFILGLGKEEGKQITYHLPIELWGECEFAETIEQAVFDFHTPSDVLERLSNLAK